MSKSNTQRSSMKYTKKVHSSCGLDDPIQITLSVLENIHLVVKLRTTSHFLVMWLRAMIHDICSEKLIIVIHIVFCYLLVYDGIPCVDYSDSEVLHKNIS